AGNGLSVGGVVGRAELVDALEANSISTFGGNPLAMAGALANIDYILSNDLQGNALKIGTYVLARLAELVGTIGVVGDVRGKGLMIGVELVQPGTKEPNPEATRAVLEEARRRGLLIGRGGLYANTLRIVPPLSV